MSKSEYHKQYIKTENGLISQIYASQKHVSKNRGYDGPNYSKQELTEWLYLNNFKKIYDDWVINNFDSKSVPSPDRLNDYLPYTLNNLRLVTWKINKEKHHSDRKNGINNKMSKSVLQYDLKGNFIKEYYSISQAVRETNVNQSGISLVCLGKRNTAGKFVWKYKN